VEELLAERDLLVGPSLSGGGFNAPELNRRVRKGQSKKTVALGRIEVVFYAMTQKICTYCDEPVTTVGHVPPKCFFSNPLPSDLITFRRALNATHNGLNWMGSLAIIGYCSGPIEPVSRISAQHVDQECPVRSTIWIRLI
jgi:hypothetical protein